MDMCRKKIFVRIIFLTLIMIIFPCVLIAENQISSEKTSAGTEYGNIKLKALKDVNDSIVSLTSVVKEKEKALKLSVSEDKKKLIQLEIDKINNLIETREKEFVSIILGDDIETFEYSSGKAFSLKDELQDIIRPAIEELKRLTKHPRDIERFRREISFYEKKVPVIKNLLENISQLDQPGTAPAIRKKLGSVRKYWSEKEKEYSRQLAKLQFQMSQKQMSKKSYLKIIQENASAFFKSRGLNIILAAGLFVIVFVLFRYLQRRFSKYVKESETTTFYHRLMKVFFHVFTILSALSAAILLLYSLGDWVLLSIILIVIAGMFWSARQGLSGYWEQIRLLLDIGSVRQGERLIYDGIPWKVVSINLMTHLINPLLQGGQIRLPLRTIVGHQSRPYHSDEPWFPTRPGDFVLLSDGTWGKVLMQTPESVIVEPPGGVHKTYPATDFLKLNPVNQSLNTFGVNTVFGIDYAEQSLITKEIPEIVLPKVTEGLKQEVYGEHLNKVTVQFKEAGASSLDLMIYVVFNGAAAEFYNAIARAVQRILVDTCTENGWVIPFSQLTLHVPENITGKEA